MPVQALRPIDAPWYSKHNIWLRVPKGTIAGQHVTTLGGCSPRQILRHRYWTGKPTGAVGGPCHHLHRW
eukprot:9813740-Karenia_brevis.AAC.1